MRLFRALAVISLAALPCLAERPSVVLDSGAAKLTIDLMGGGIVGFELKGLALNPFTWEQKGAEDESRPRGHFLCLDRWGAPSDAEKANGMPFHGEASKVVWKVTRQSELEVEMSATLPLAKLSIVRVVKIIPGTSLVEVSETVKNLNTLGRIFNWVQHPSIAPPFLDESTIVNANAGEGFPQWAPMPEPEEMAERWPMARGEKNIVDVSKLTNDPNPNVVSYVVDSEMGWTTATTPSKGLLVGYLWSTKDYPWFNVWRHVENGKPAARGLEFGTTGLHQPYPVLVKKGSILGRPLYAYLDAGESQTRSYAMFLAKVPNQYSGTAVVARSGKRITIREKTLGRSTIVVGPPQ